MTEIIEPPPLVRPEPQFPIEASGYTPRRPSMMRTSAEFASLARRVRIPTDDLAALAATEPRGDGSAVLVLPGVMRGDPQTANLRSFLDLLGYVAFGWDLGTNHGPISTLMQRALTRLKDLAAAHGPVAVVGFSMGGLLARWLALQATPCVRQVITIGSPVRATLHSVFVPAMLLKYAWRGEDLDRMAAELAEPIDVPLTHIYSRSDGIVAWDSCRDPDAPDRNIEVDSPHVLMEQDTAVFRAVARRLAGVRADVADAAAQPRD